MQLLKRFLTLVMILLASEFVVAQPQATIDIDLPAQPIELSVRRLAETYKLQLVYLRTELAGISAPAVKGRFTAAEAMAKVTQGTGVEATFSRNDTVVIKPPAPRRTSEVEAARLGPIVVTGTHIAGAQPSSPLVSITSEDMRLAGHNNMGEVIRALPQNFAGGQNPGVVLASGAGVANPENRNISGASSINLRGLGAGATLVLLNGARLPYDGFRHAIDVSAIPVSAIERVEILLDGASAVYGSDAVAGVVNIILKRDYNGASLGARYGEATDGGYRQTQLSAVAGTTWAGGGFVVTGDSTRNTAVTASQRSYLSHLPEPYDIYPDHEQASVVLSAHQRLGATATAAVDAFYNKRRQEMWTRQSAASRLFEDPESSAWAVTPSLQLKLPASWSARIHATTGTNNADFHSRSFSVATGAQTSETATRYQNTAHEIAGGANGRLFALPAGAARAAAGVGYRKNEFDEINRLTGATRVAGSRHSAYGYGELELPLLSDRQAVPLVQGLRVNAAVRSEDYSDFGQVTTPKVGVLWDITADVAVKGSWGRSFKTPTLTEQFSTSIASLFPGAVFPGLPAGSTVLFLQGGNTRLGPERADVATAGIVFSPRALPGLTLEANAFDIDYTDRITPPVTSLTQAFSNPAFADFVLVGASSEQQAALIAGAQSFVNNAGVPYDASRVYGVIFNQNTNVSRERSRGVDLLGTYAAEAFGGKLTVTANASWLENRRNVTRLAPEVPTSGVIYFPGEFRGRMGVRWDGRGLTVASYVNYIDGEINDRVTPSHQVASLTTVDLVVEYQLRTRILGNLALNVGVVNLLDREPPFARTTNPALFVPYDPANHSALGRIISATVTARF